LHDLAYSHSNPNVSDDHIRNKRQFQQSSTNIDSGFGLPNTPFFGNSGVPDTFAISGQSGSASSSANKPMITIEQARQLLAQSGSAPFPGNTRTSSSNFGSGSGLVGAQSTSSSGFNGFGSGSGLTPNIAGQRTADSIPPTSLETILF
jgi:hypothetical protein